MVMDRIEMLFGPECRKIGFEYVCCEEQLDALRETEAIVGAGGFTEVKAKLPNGDMAVFKLKGEEVEVSREMKRKKTV